MIMIWDIKEISVIIIRYFGKMYQETSNDDFTEVI
jgi:hypothetical protein